MDEKENGIVKRSIFFVILYVYVYIYIAYIAVVRLEVNTQGEVTSSSQQVIFVCYTCSTAAEYRTGAAAWAILVFIFLAWYTLVSSSSQSLASRQISGKLAIRNFQF